VVLGGSTGISHIRWRLGKEHAQFLEREVASVLYVPACTTCPGCPEAASSHEHRCGSDYRNSDPGRHGHDEIVAQHAARKLMDLSLEFDKPVTLGIPALRCPGPMLIKRVDYAKRAVEAAVKLVTRLEEIELVSERIANIHESTTLKISAMPRS